MKILNQKCMCIIYRTKYKGIIICIFWQKHSHVPGSTSNVTGKISQSVRDWPPCSKVYLIKWPYLSINGNCSQFSGANTELNIRYIQITKSTFYFCFWIWTIPDRTLFKSLTRKPSTSQTSTSSLEAREVFGFR